MFDLELLPSFEDTKAVYFGTIHKSIENINNQVRFQKNSENPVFYEEFSFYNGPIIFHSFLIFQEGESVTLKSEESTVDFVSETSVKPDGGEFRAFVRVVDEKGLLKYKQLSLVDNYGKNMVFVDTESLESKSRIFVDRILVVGSFKAISYLVLAFKTTFKRFATWNLFNKNVYYGKDILDLNKHTIASESLCEPITNGNGEGWNGLKGVKETRSGTYKTMHDLTNYLMVNEQYEKIQNLKKNLNYLVDVDKSEKRLDETMAMLSKFACNELLFKEYLDYNALEGLTKFVYTNMAYEHDDHNYKLMKLLLHDTRIAKYLLNSLHFGKTLELVFSEESTLDQKSCLLNLLLILLSHPMCITRFLSNESYERGFSYDYFVNNIHTSEAVGSVYLRLLEDIGGNLELYLSLTQTQTLYNKLSKENMEFGGGLDENLRHLSIAVNHSLDTAMKKNKKKEDWTQNKIRFVKNYVVTCMKELQFIKALEYLLSMVYWRLSEFPVLSLDAKAFVDKPFRFIQSYMEYFQFKQSITTLYQIATLVMKLCAPLSGTVRSGFPYLQGSVREYFDVTSKQCLNMLLYGKVLSLLSFTISQGSFDATIEQIDALSTKYENFYHVFSKFVEKPTISNFILKSLNSYVILVRDDTPSPIMNKISKNVSLLVNLICKTIYRERNHNIVSEFGRGFVHFMEYCLPKLTNKTGYLDTHLVETCVSLFNNMHSFTNFNADSQRKEIIEDVGDFIWSVVKHLGFENKKIFRDYGEVRERDVLDACEDNEQNSSPTLSTNIKHPHTSSPRANKGSRPNQSIQHGHQWHHGNHGNHGNRAIVSRNGNKKRKLGDQESVSALYFNLLKVKNIDLYATSTCGMERAKQLGVQLDTFKYYESCGLAVLPPDGVPAEIDYALSFLLTLAQTRENAHLFKGFMDKESTKPLLGIWLYALSTLKPDLNTLVNAEVNAFSSLVGYSWIENLDRCVSTLTKIVYLCYLGLRHLSLDTVHDAGESIVQNSLCAYTEESEGMSIHYINDELLNCLILSSTHVATLSRMDTERSRNYMEMLSSFTYYWFKRFKKSRQYILNYMMQTATVLPNMYEGVCFLIVSCKPFTSFRTDMTYRHLRSEGKVVTPTKETTPNTARPEDKVDEETSMEYVNGLDDGVNKREDSKSNEVMDNDSSASEEMEIDVTKNENEDCKMDNEQLEAEKERMSTNGHVEQENTSKTEDEETKRLLYNNRTFTFHDAAYELEEKKSDNLSKGVLNKVALMYKELDKKVLMEFICTVCAHSNSVDPGSLISSSYMYYFLFMNDSPLVEFTRKLVRDMEDLNSRLRALVFYSNVVRVYILDIVKRVESMFGLNCDFMDLIITVINREDLPLYAYPVVLEAIYFTVSCQNKHLSLDKMRLIGHRKFTHYVRNMASCVSWLFTVVNSVKFDFLKNRDRECAEGKDLLESDSLIFALHIIWTLFQVPFNTLTMVYSLYEATSFAKRLNIWNKLEKRTPRGKDRSESSRQHDKSSKAANHGETSGDMKPLEAKLCECLTVNNMVDRLRELCSEPEKLSAESVFKVLYSYHMLLGIYNAILQTGKNQDIVILHMSLNLPYDQLTVMSKPEDLFETTLTSLEVLLKHVKSSEGLKHMAAQVLLVKTSFEELKEVLLETYQPTIVSSVEVFSLFEQQKVEQNVFYYTGTVASFTTSLVPTIRSYRSWRHWVRFVSLASFEVDYEKKESFLPFTKNVDFEYELEYPEFDEDISRLKFEVSVEKPARPKSVVTVDQWKEFAKQLSDRGLDLMALVKNPSMLLEPKSRRHFLRALLKNKQMYEHITKLGVDVFN
ncbi:hypothetical protein MACK_001430 [Theileria orientalis]|uniref:Uncharacterized protein n=1 Tax=Theileria orientalis TaxID=68886 RepID=A0A976MCY2_THEOR|nr:hypothetical protein MACK_001430 [Theileria orientalis]